MLRRCPSTCRAAATAVNMFPAHATPPAKPPPLVCETMPTLTRRDVVDREAIQIMQRVRFSLAIYFRRRAEAAVLRRQSCREKAGHRAVAAVCIPIIQRGALYNDALLIVSCTLSAQAPPMAVVAPANTLTALSAAAPDPAPVGRVTESEQVLTLRSCM